MSRFRIVLSPRRATAASNLSSRMDSALKAIQAKNAEELGECLEADPGLLKQHTASGATLLTASVAAGNEDAVNTILEAAQAAELSVKEVVDFPDQKGLTPLAHAARHGCVDMAKKFIGSNDAPLADVNLADHQGLTPLYHATQRGHRRAHGAGTQVARALLQRNDLQPDRVSETSRHPQTPMELAIQRGKHEIVSAVVGHPAADLNRLDRHGIPPMWQAMTQWARHPNRSGNQPQWTLILQALLAHPAVQANVRNKSGQTLLTYLCSKVPEPGPYATKDDAKWLATSLKAILSASRSPAQLSLDAANGQKDSALSIAQRKTHSQPAYSALVGILKTEAAIRTELRLAFPDLPVLSKQNLTESTALNELMEEVKKVRSMFDGHQYGDVIKKATDLMNEDVDVLTDPDNQQAPLFQTDFHLLAEHLLALYKEAKSRVAMTGDLAPRI